MLRGTDTPTTVTERLNATDDQVKALNRAQAQGTEALLNDAGHKMLLNPQNPNPLIVAQGGNDQIDSGLGFSQGTLQVLSQDGQQWRDIEAAGLVLHDSVDVPSATVGAGGIKTTGAVDAGPVNATVLTSQGVLRGDSAQITNAIHAASLNGDTAALTGNLNTNGVNIGNYGMWSNGPLAIQSNISAPTMGASSSMSTWNMTANGNVTLAGRAWNAIVSTVDTLYNWWESLPSGRALKERFAPVDDADADALLAAPVQRWAWAEEPWLEEEPMPPEAHGPRRLLDRRPDEREHYGPLAEDVPEIMQVVNPEGRLGVDLHSYAGLLLRICQRQQAQIEDLTGRLAALEDRSPA